MKLDWHLWEGENMKLRLDTTEIVYTARRLFQLH